MSRKNIHSLTWIKEMCCYFYLKDSSICRVEYFYLTNADVSLSMMIKTSRLCRHLLADLRLCSSPTWRSGWGRRCTCPECWAGHCTPSGSGPRGRCRWPWGTPGRQRWRTGRWTERWAEPERRKSITDNKKQEHFTTAIPLKTFPTLKITFYSKTKS